MIVVYGIRNCDSCRKALTWLADQGIAHAFHDFRKDGLEQAKVAEWLEAIDPDILINRRGTTYRKLSETDRELTKGADLVALLTRLPTLIKRPVIETGEGYEIGFKPAVQDRLEELAKKAD